METGGLHTSPPALLQYTCSAFLYLSAIQSALHEEAYLKRKRNSIKLLGEVARSAAKECRCRDIDVYKAGEFIPPFL